MTRTCNCSLRCIIRSAATSSSAGLVAQLNASNRGVCCHAYQSGESSPAYASPPNQSQNPKLVAFVARFCIRRSFWARDSRISKKQNKTGIQHQLSKSGTFRGKNTGSGISSNKVQALGNTAMRNARSHNGTQEEGIWRSRFSPEELDAKPAHRNLW